MISARKRTGGATPGTRVQSGPSSLILSADRYSQGLWSCSMTLFEKVCMATRRHGSILRWTGLVAVVVGMIAGSLSSSQLTGTSTRSAGTLNFVSFDVPGATLTRGIGINSHGDVVGVYIDNQGVHHGFLKEAGRFNSIDVPGASGTEAKGINSSGDVVGFYWDSGGLTHGFLMQGKRFRTIDVSGASQGTILWAVTDDLKIAGSYDRDDLIDHGFALVNGRFTEVDFPGSQGTDPYGMNNLGLIVGTYVDSNGARAGFLLNHGGFGIINVPGAGNTTARGLNNQGRIVGYDTMQGVAHGFMLENGAFTTVDFPAASATWARGINTLGEITGSYSDASGVEHGFTATSTF